VLLCYTQTRDRRLNIGQFFKLKNAFSDRMANLTLVTLLSVSLLITYLAFVAVARQNRQQLENLTERITTNITRRINRYENALIQLRAHMVTSPKVTRQSYQAYFEHIMLLENYPGIQGLGYTVRVPRSQLQQYEAGVRREGFPDFKVWPEHEREDYFSIHYLEPFDWRNKRAFGFDMFTEEIRRKAMSGARDTAAAAVTGMVKLVQETSSDVQPGFLVYLPVYRSDTQRPATLEERREQLVGFVYAPFRALDLFTFIFKTDPTLYENVHVEIFDGDGTRPEQRYFNNDLLASEESSQYLAGKSTIVPFNVLGHGWTIRTRLRMTSEMQVDRALPFILGGVLTLLSFMVFWIVAASRKHAQELGRAVAARDEFMSLASHELKTPLTSLTLQAQILERMFSKDGGQLDQKRVEKFAATTLTQVERLTRLVDDLLDISRINTGVMKLQKSRVDICAVVTDVVERTLPLFEKNGVPAPEVVLCPSVMMEIDQLRIEQVLTNLITNALRYGRGRPVVIKLEHLGPEVLLSITDQGIGIEQKNLNKVFDRFQRFVDPQVTGGLGLGLYLTQKIVATHGGRIWAESVIGEGTTFFVQLPVSSPA
jgi:two-component system, OmpR family, sensor kinase